MASKNTTREQERFEEEVDRLADERGISFSAALALKTSEAPPPAKEKGTAKEKKQVTRKDFEELQAGIRELEELTDRNLEMMVNREVEEAATDGTINRNAREQGISVREATVKMDAELRVPGRKIKREAAERRSRIELARELEVEPETLETRPHVETPKEEREMYGYTVEEAEAHAKRNGVSFRDACIELEQRAHATPLSRWHKERRAAAVELAQLLDEEGV